jgi:hypothetical protein
MQKLNMEEESRTKTMLTQILKSQRMRSREGKMKLNIKKACILLTLLMFLADLRIR